MSGQVTTNVIRRVVMIRYGTSAGTSFTLDVDNRQYLVTASHVVNGLVGTGKVDIFHDSKWIEIPVTRLTVDPDVDIAVLAPAMQLTVSLDLPSSDRVTYGGEVYFLGFPYGLSVPAKQINGLYPIPFVKRAVVSAIITEHARQYLYLDGINNPGFSGGPVVLLDPQDRYPQGNPKVKVIGVISGFKAERTPVQAGGGKTPFVVETNTGIIQAVMIKHALDAIRKNPIGAKTEN